MLHLENADLLPAVSPCRALLAHGSLLLLNSCYTDAVQLMLLGSTWLLCCWSAKAAVTTMCVRRYF